MSTVTVNTKTLKARDAVIDKLKEVVFILDKKVKDAEYERDGARRPPAAKREWTAETQVCCVLRGKRDHRAGCWA